MARKRKKRTSTATVGAGPKPPRNWRLIGLGGGIFAVGLVALIAALQLN